MRHILPEDGSFRVYGVVRSVLDTLPAYHPAHARVWLVSSGAGLLQPTPYAADVTLSAKLLPYDNSHQVDEASVTAASLTTNSRAFKPYAPGRLRVTALPNGDVVFSWAHRPRRRMLADDRIVDRDYDEYTEAEGSYTVEVLVGGVVKHVIESITDKSYRYTRTQRLADATDMSLPVSFAIKSVDGAFSSATLSTTEVLM